MIEKLHNNNYTRKIKILEALKISGFKPDPGSSQKTSAELGKFI